MRLTRAIPTVVTAATLCACAGGRGGSAAPRAPEPSPAGSVSAAKADPSRLTSDDIAAANLPNAYELVNRLRRPWLRRDAVTGGDVAVYMDDQRLGGAEKLRDIPAVEVGELRFLPNLEAVRRWGSEVTGSVILVVRRR